MTAEEKIQALLVANASLIAVVPASRIKGPGDWQGLDLPYIEHWPVAPDPGIYTYGNVALQPWRKWSNYQVNCYAASVSEAKTIADLVVTALSVHDSEISWVMLNRPFPLPSDTDRKVLQYVVDFQIAGNLT